MKNFFKAVIENFNHIGGLFPSTPFAAQSISKKIPAGAKHLVEYGPGTGVITKVLLKKLPTNGKLIAVELNSIFIQDLKKWKDNRLQLFNEDVLSFSKHIKQHFPEGADAIVSGIPFSFLQKEMRSALIESTYDALKTGGVFVLYQNTPTLYPLLKRTFHNLKLSIEPRNMPPYFILVGKK